MTLSTRKTRKGWAIYNGRTRYLTTTYPTKAQALERIRVESQWGQGPSIRSTNPLYARTA